MPVNRTVSGSVRIDDAFWSPKLRTFFDVTVPDTFDKLEKDGVIENYRNLIAGNLGTHKICPWHDGLLLEAIRGAADYLRRGERSDALERRIDGYADVIEQAQLVTTGGYIHTYTQLNRPDRLFGENGGNILWQHDLYNQGALFEAGVHYYLATGKTKLLACAVRCANQLAELIGPPPKKWYVPGHSLPEYALLELYDLAVAEPDLADRLGVPVCPEAYRTLADFWVRGRGHHEHRTNNPQYMGEYSQDHAPIEKQFQAVGHAVRATLYYTGVTRLAILEDDEDLLSHSLRLWENVVTRKLHINGGIGATHFEEKFGADYDLVNTAYLETCATVGLIFWAESLSRATGDAQFFHVIERGLYNLMLSSVTLQGDGYFYRNPLQSDGSDHHWAWHGCPCCPPMIHKLFGMIDRLVAAQDDDSLTVNLLTGGMMDAQFAWGTVSVRTESDLPWIGRYRLTVESAGKPFTLRLRIPEWATNAALTVNGTAVSPAMVRGYAVFTVQAGDVITLEDPLPVRRIEAHPYVECDRGRVAIMRGPLVYCLEGVDNRGETDIELPADPAWSAEHLPDLLGGVTVLRGTAASGSFTAVPLYVWDNRLAGKMAVWLRQSGKPVNFDTTGWEGRLYREYNP